MSNTRIVSSAHFVSNGPTELIKFKIGLDMGNNAYNHWIVRCTAATVQDGLDEQAARSAASL